MARVAGRPRFAVIASLSIDPLSLDATKTTRPMRQEHLERRCYSTAALRSAARRALPRVVFDFVDGGAEDETTLRRNEAAFAEIALRPKPLAGTSGRDQSVTLF